MPRGDDGTLRERGPVLSEISGLWERVSELGAMIDEIFARVQELERELRGSSREEEPKTQATESRR